MTTTLTQPPTEATPQAQGAPDSTCSPATPSSRLVSIDAFRGLWVVLMVSAGLGIHGMVERLWSAPQWQHLRTPTWQWLAYHTDHAAWAGVTLWDFIQSSFMFTVGCALAFSVAARKAKGHSFGRMLGHAIFRSVALVLLSVFLISSGPRTNWQFTNVLAQIGLGYVFLFLIAFLRPRWQFVTAIGVLALYWGAFALYPKPPANLDPRSVDLPADWLRLEGFASHWEKNTNLAARADQWFLNQFPPYHNAPPQEKFRFNGGGYQTLSFVPSLATMIFGLLCGELIRSRTSNGRKLLYMLLAGGAGLAIGWGLGRLGVCPIVKRIWTPSWAIYSAGWAFLVLAAFYTVIEVAQFRWWAFPLVVVGANPIAAYCMWQLLSPWLHQNVNRHLGPGTYRLFGDAYVPMVERGLVLAFCWGVCWWMYRRRVFLRI